MSLSDAKIRSIKPSDKPFKLTDSQGRYLLVNPGGSRLWYLKYRFNRKESRIALGAYPQVSLSGARQQRDGIRKRLDYIPAQFVVKRYVRPQYGCDGCQRVVSGSLPAQIIPKGIPEAGLVAHTARARRRAPDPSPSLPALPSHTIPATDNGGSHPAPTHSVTSVENTRLLNQYVTPGCASISSHF